MIQGLSDKACIHHYSLGHCASSDGHPRSEEIQLLAGSRQTVVQAWGGRGVGGGGQRSREILPAIVLQIKWKSEKSPSLPPSLALSSPEKLARQNGNSIRPNQTSSMSADSQTTLLISLKSRRVHLLLNL